MATIQMRLEKRLRLMSIVQIAIALVALLGLVRYGLPSPDERPKVYELYLAGVWGLMTVSCISVYTGWSATRWYRRGFALAAPLMGLLYLYKFFWG